MRRDRQPVPARSGSTTSAAKGVPVQTTGGASQSASTSTKPAPASASVRGGSASSKAGSSSVQPKVLFSTTCWSCGQAVHKPVTKRNLRQRHFSWMCTDCDVSWWGPGQEV